MSIASEITRLQGCKSDIRSALVNKGITSASTHNMADFATDISNITAGGATITVTYDSSFYNKTITCSNGSKTYTKTTTSSGSTEFSVSDEGTWTITCNGVSVSLDVTLNYATQMKPTGSTATPVNDIQTWLKCGGIFDKTYTTINQVLADTTTLLALISDSNAVDYMVRSTDFVGSDNLVPQMTSNTTPSGEVGTGYYSNSWRAFDRNDSTHTEVTTENVNGYVYYKFEEPTLVTGFEAKLGNYAANNSFTVKFQFSDDGNTWTDIGESFIVSGHAAGNYGAYTGEFNITSKHLYYRLYLVTKKIVDTNVYIYSLKFNLSGITTNQNAMFYIGANDYCAKTLLSDATWRTAICNSFYFESVLNVEVPTMTSNTEPEGECICSGQTNNKWAYESFDRSQSADDGWYHNANPCWFGYIFPKPVCVNYFFIQEENTTPIIFTKYDVQASNDGTAWITLGSYDEGSAVDAQYFYHSFANENYYTHYRFYIYSAASCQTAQFYGRASS